MAGWVKPRGNHQSARLNDVPEAVLLPSPHTPSPHSCHSDRSTQTSGYACRMSGTAPLEAWLLRWRLRDSSGTVLRDFLKHVDVVGHEISAPEEWAST